MIIALADVVTLVCAGGAAFAGIVADVLALIPGAGEHLLPDCTPVTG